MLRVGFSEVWSHKRRLAGSMIAVVLGVAFLAGTLLLGDTLKANFDKLFTTANGSTDVILRGSTQIGSDINQSRSGVDAALLGLARSTPGVADAEPYVQGFGQLVGSNGKRIGGNGPPTTAANWVGVPSLNPYRIVAGHAPQADNEVVINRGAAKTAKLHLGDTTTLLTPRPIRVTIVGISTFGTADGFGPSTFTAMTLHAATTYLTDDPNKVTQILIKAAPGVASQQLIGELQPRLPGGVQAITGTDLANENISDINSGFLGFLRNALTGFAVIALLVAVFSIYNTFSILGAQRSRSSALLRAIGATRRQVVTVGLSEALAVGVVGSLAGWAAGIGIAAGLKGVFGGFGFALPAGGLVFRASSAAIAMLAGIAATLVAGILPALRSSRVPPVAALRDQAAEPRSVSGRRAALGGVTTAGGVTTLVLAAARPGPVALAVAGAVLALVGMVVLGPVVARPAAVTLGAPIARMRGITGTLARENAMRNPRRTAATASALLIGVAVVAMFTVVAASLKASAAHGVDRALTADIVVDTPGFGGGVSSQRGRLDPTIGARLSTVDGVQAATGLSGGDALIDGKAHAVTVADPARVGDVLDLGVTSGALSAMTSASLAVSADAAKSNHWHVGSTAPITYPDGAHGTVTVAAIYSHPDITGDYLLTAAGWAPHTDQAVVSKVLVKLRPGTDVAAAKDDIAAATSGYGAPRVQDRSEYRASATAGVSTFLGLIYVMLALAIVIALMGISNTLSLSIHERTRELGLLRAVGQTRGQARAMVRWESVLVAVFGTVGGIGLGALLGWSLVKAAGSTTLSVFTAPPAQLAAFVVVGAVAGTLAGIRPARRAARLSVLRAISAE
ncbi:MAG TPA: FtsX-like permease family protein [Jatrophihabitantaceae bacterium]|jgi:putative ABC transport system permease protein